MKPKLIAIIAVIIVLIVGLVVISLLLASSQGNNPNGNANNFTSSQNISTPPNLVGLQDPEISQKYPIAGIKSDDTVVVINPTDKDEIVLTLENKKWRFPKWSPNGKLLAVLGQTNSDQNVYDVFVYDLEKAEWIQVSNFASLGVGVDSLAWFGDTRLVYTQGTLGNHWLHRYDYVNQETRKEFLTEDLIVAVHTESQRFIFQRIGNSPEFALVGFNGKEFYRFSVNLFPQGHSLVNMLGRDGSDTFLLFTREGERQHTYLWNLDNPELVKIDYTAYSLASGSTATSEGTTSTSASPLQQLVFTPVCLLSSSSIALIENQINDKLFSLRTLDLDLADFSDRQSLDVIASRVNANYPKFAAICGQQNILLSVTEQISEGKFETRWYLATIDPLRLQFVELAKDYTDLDVK